MAVQTRSAKIRARLNHPVIDSDGHTVEFDPAVLEYLREIAGPKLVDEFRAYNNQEEGPAWTWYRSSPAERAERRVLRPFWWAIPMRNTLDRATASLPRLLHERMDEIGLDFTVLYPTWWLWANVADEQEMRQAACRAINNYHADLFREYADRMTPVALIPMHTPEEAINELEYAVATRGMKAIMMAGHVRRPLPKSAGYWLDTLGLDSAYDYDPVWKKCVELGVCPTFHTVGMGWDARSSISNSMYNHIGHFAAAGEATCRALFMGGVTRRFPNLKFAFLEGGVGWACSLYADLIGHWQKRNRSALENYNPENLDQELLEGLFRRYGEKSHEGKLDALRDAPAGTFYIHEDPTTLDEWSACGIEKPEDIRDLFVPHFFFGCEADDPINAWAFNEKTNPFGSRLQAIFSSDIGHWDVPDMRRVLEEAYEPVEKKLISEQDFRDFVFSNPVSLWTALNPDFFTGTAVEGEVRKLRLPGN